MSWVTGEPDNYDAVLGRRPELVSRYRAFYRSFWAEGLMRRRILELTRLRIAAIHECAQEWEVRDSGVILNAGELDALRNGNVSAFSDDERAALQLAELMPFAHHQISDQHVAEAERRFGAPGAVTLLTALAFFDANCRLRIVLDVATTPGPVNDPPLRDGALV